MAAHKYIDRICLAAALVSLLISLLFLNSQALGIQSVQRVMGYENRLFDTSRVHTIDIVMDGWDGFIDTCEDEEYASCAVVIDGEAYKNVGLRAKGNTSLSTVSRLDSDRYSFKIEFDHYEAGRTYYGLDKLSLNNIIQDNTYMKDYLVYQMMGAFGANAPLCSYAYITVNGQDWGLYLAVEAVEDSFLQRNYGAEHGALYKPDQTNFGGGRGNGRGFDFDDFDLSGLDHAEFESSPAGPSDFNNLDRINFDWDSLKRDNFGFGGFGQNGGIGGMGSSDVNLQYIDDDPDSYANIFSSAKTDITGADKVRLIQSLKALSEGGDVSSVVDIDQALRYFVVHNFVVNGDSYTGSMVHNYYLYEENGRLSMLPWDYNLAFGTFMGNNANSAVNDPIDTPLSVTGDGGRPMADWIFSSEEYTQLYHQYFEKFFSTVDPIVIIEKTRALIAPYVEKDPSRFCTCEEFETGVETLSAFCTLRAQSVQGQLSGAIPSTSAGQSAALDTLVDASALTLSDMGTMNNGGGLGGVRPGNAAASRQDEETLPVFGAAQPEPSDEEAGAQRGWQLPRGEGGGTQPTLGEDGGIQPALSGDQPAGENMPSRPGGTQIGGTPGTDVSQSGTTLILLGVSTLTLLLGLAIAFKFKR